MPGSSYILEPDFFGFLDVLSASEDGLGDAGSALCGLAKLGPLQEAGEHGVMNAITSSQPC